MTPVRLEPAASRSRVKHSTTKPLRSFKMQLRIFFFYQGVVAHFALSKAFYPVLSTGSTQEDRIKSRYDREKMLTRKLSINTKKCDNNMNLVPAPGRRQSKTSILSTNVDKNR